MQIGVKEFGETFLAAIILTPPQNTSLLSGIGRGRFIAKPASSKSSPGRAASGRVIGKEVCELSPQHENNPLTTLLTGPLLPLPSSANVAGLGPYQ